MAGSLGYQTREDIVNRGLQHCRKRRIVSLSPPDSSDAARETAFVYDKLREAELRCNLWRFATKRAILRPISTSSTVIATSIDCPSGTTLTFASTAGATTGPIFSSNGMIASNTTCTAFTATTATLSQAVSGDIPLGTAITFGPQTLLWTPPTYAAGTTYSIGGVVADANGEWWQSKVSSNLANTPVPGASWQHYTGVDYLMPWDTTKVYFTGELVLASNSSVYMSLTSQNGTGVTGNNPTSTSGFWLLVNGTTAALSFYYPIGTGPSTEVSSLNCFRLPHGFLRQAPSDPHATTRAWLGGPAGHPRDDWSFEDNYIVSGDVGPLLLRYIQNIVDVPVMDAMFCEMLAARVAEEVAPLLVDDTKLLGTIVGNVRHHYKSERFKATTVNAIEIGPIDLEMDDYVRVRF